MAWTIDYTATAKKQLRTLDSRRGTGEALTGPMLGAYWRYRVGDCRVICDIQDGALRVLVIQIGNRANVYR